MNLMWSAIMMMLGFFFSSGGGQAAEVIKLPPPAHKSAVSLEDALLRRRTVRHFASRGLDLNQVSQLLWGTDGVSDPRGLRTAPSAGATYPVDLYLVVGERGVATVPAGVYHYLPKENSLKLITPGELRPAVARASLSQSWMAEAPIMVVITGEYRRCMARYGERGIRYTIMEVGHTAENLFLQAEALGLGAGIVGAFEDRTITQVLKTPAAHEPLLIMPVGYKH
ncbi:MAG: SagB/ThcOx family dehydrogenase [Desulfobaccales bacterium]|nr:SagB/ThcOx family dehydrogenase [Desulfobaccales bacterium]